jgi:hypothetical protein
MVDPRTAALLTMKDSSFWLKLMEETMATEQQVNSLRNLVEHNEEIIGKIKEALADEDPAMAETLLAELEENNVTIGQAVARLVPAQSASTPEEPESDKT